MRRGRERGPHVQDDRDGEHEVRQRRHRGQGQQPVVPRGGPVHRQVKPAKAPEVLARAQQSGRTQVR